MNLDPEFEALLDYLKLSLGYDLTVYKRSNLMRRFQYRMQMLTISRYGDYLEYLKLYPEECVPLLNTFLINVTSFFRDRDAWDFLAEQIIPQIIARKEPNEPIRVWSAACASGEEAYTLTILLAEALGNQFLERVKIYATDVDREAIQQARLGEFNAQDVMNIPDKFLKKYFEQKTEQRYVFSQQLRPALIFGYHNLIEDAPISQLDLLVCRNTLIYFTTSAQAKILVRFHFALNNNCFLFLGKAETCYNSHLFRFVTSKQHIFTKISKRSRREQILLTNKTFNQ